MIRAIWVCTKEGHVPLSRRYKLVERKHKSQCLTSDLDGKLARGSTDAPPLDSELGRLTAAAFLRQKRGFAETPLHGHLLSLSASLWPVVVVEEGKHLIAVLPLVPFDAILSHQKLSEDLSKHGHATTHAPLAQHVQDVAAIPLAVEVAVSLGGILSERRKEQGPEAEEARYARAWNFLLDGIPAGTPLDTDVLNVERIVSAPTVHKPLRESVQPYWKPLLYKGRHKIKFHIEETLRGFLCPVEIQTSKEKEEGEGGREGGREERKTGKERD